MRLLTIQGSILTIAVLAVSVASGGDREIAREITQRLKEEQQAGTLKGFDVNLRVSHGEVILCGHVSSASQFRLVERTSRAASGVTAVDNRLGVRIYDEPRLASTRTPQSAANPEEDASSIEMAGEACWAVLKILVQVLTLGRSRDTPSEPLEQNLAVDGDSAPQVSSDREIAAILGDVAGILARQQEAGNLQGFNITLQWDDGTLTLTGHVSSRRQYDAVEAAAAGVEGVSKVRNELAVRKGPRANPVRPTDNKPVIIDGMSSRLKQRETDPELLVRQDREIAEEAAAVLREQGQAGKLSGYGIRLNVDDGVLVLKGRVSNKQQFDLVGTVVSRVPGVVRVENGLTIIDGPHMQLVPPPESKPKVVEPEPLD